VEIKVSELARVTTLLYEHLEEKIGESFTLSVDYYWNIPSPEVYDLDKEPTALTIGQVSDDWGELKKLLEPDGDELSYHLVWLAAVLRAIGEQEVS
jgi:hypothetical protein